MCTAITFSGKDFYFGRTLDLERTYGEEVVITPRNFPLNLRHETTIAQHLAIIGIAHVAEGYPLYYDAVNEAGLCMAGLNFSGFAKYGKVTEGKNNIACFELIPWILSQCRNVKDVRELLESTHLTDTPFSLELPTAELHWIVADKSGCITLESVTEGLRVYENPLGVLTNNPPFEHQMYFLQNFMQVSANPPENRFAPDLELKPFSRGMGGIGLPGDLSSQSRFVRTAFTKGNSVCEDPQCVSQFFHILDTVSQTRGCCRLEDGSMPITQYTACCNASRGIYYYTTYGNRRIHAVDLHREDIEKTKLIRFPLLTEEDILHLNANTEISPPTV